MAPSGTDTWSTPPRWGSSLPAKTSGGYLDAHYAAIGGYTGFTMIGIAVEPAGEERSRVIVRVRAKPVEGASAVHDHVLEAVSGEDGLVVAHPAP